MQYPFITNARIVDADISFSRGFILDCHLTLGFEGAGQGFGGYVLGGNPFDTTAVAARHKDQPNIAAHFIGGVLAIAGVEHFSQLKGKIVRVGKEDEWGSILAIGHAIDDKWFDPKVELEKLGAGRG